MFSFELKATGVLVATFSDPTSRNAFSLKAARELRDRIAHRDFSALLCKADGRVFCSGGQLSDYAAMTSADEGRRVNDEIRDALSELASLHVPTIAAVRGDAFGGGVEFLSCFDLVISAPHVMFGLWQRKIGLSFGWGGGARLEKRIGGGALRHLTLSTIPITAHEALRLGLIDLVVHEHDLDRTALEKAETLSALPSEPLLTLKNFEPATEAESFNKLWWNTSHRAVLASRKR